MEPPTFCAGASGQLAAKPTEDDAGAEDRLSALPDDFLLRVLVGLDDAAAAGRTSVLSTRWRRLWRLLPELRFPFPCDPGAVASALAAHEAAISHLSVETLGAAADSVAAWLPAVARRLYGSLVITNRPPQEGDADGEDDDGGGAFELPCLAHATSVSLDLGGCLGVAVPLPLSGGGGGGVFARLTQIFLARVEFTAPFELGDAVSSPRCPCLQKLTVRDVTGLYDLTVHSSSLLHMELDSARGLQQLTVVAPALVKLSVLCCFMLYLNRPVASISAPALRRLGWGDFFNPRSVRLGTMDHLQSVWPQCFLVYGFWPSFACLELLGCFKVIQELHLTLVYLPDITNQPYLMEDMTRLPDITSLHLNIYANGHAFGASSFHVLRLCSGMRELVVRFSGSDVKEQTACPPGCICDEQESWKTEKLLLNHLQEIEINELTGSQHDVAFVKQLLNWATVLKKMTVTFNSSVTESMANELCQVLQNFCGLDLCEFYLYKDKIKVLYALED